jgi:hypothetical protein
MRLLFLFGKFMLSEKIKYWFSDGEWDVDLMLSMGVISEEAILAMYNKEHPQEIEKSAAE